MNIHALARSAVLSAVVSFSTGCGAGLFATENGHDAQACAEAALRRGEGAGVEAEAYALFLSSCSADDGGACSALGVVYENGVGVARDLSTAGALYRRACWLENRRGCTNLALLELALHPEDTVVAARSRWALGVSCDHGDRLACGRLGRMTRDGVGGSVDVTSAVELFERACGDGESAACVDLASAIAGAAPARAMELYARACTAGDPEACAALGAVGRRAPAGGGTVASR